MRSLSTLDPVDSRPGSSRRLWAFRSQQEPDGGRTPRAAMSADRCAWRVVDVSDPDDSAKALVLVEHHWASELGEAIEQAGGFRIGAGVVDLRPPGGGVSPEPLSSRSRSPAATA